MCLFHGSQISCTSSAPALSDKLRYPSFFRVVPNDIHQTRALVEFIRHFEWEWVGVVSLDDDYGRAVLEMFLQDVRTEGRPVCVRFQEVLPNYLGFVNMSQSIKQAADKIQNNPNVTVVLLILRPELVKSLFEEMIRRKISRTWIASDAWSTIRFVMEMDQINNVGDIFGFTFITGNIPGFEDYLKNLSPGTRNDFIQEYKQLRFGCTPGQISENTSPFACNITDPQEANDDYLVNTVYLGAIYSQRVAVYAVAHAIKRLLNCSDTSCSGDIDFLPWKVKFFCCCL